MDNKARIKLDKQKSSEAQQNIEKKPRSGKDASVELLRIIGCIMVIGVHVNQGIMYFDKASDTGILITCLVGDGVAIFWMIMGFYLFKSDYKKLLKKSVRHILIPMFAYTIFMMLFGKYLAGATPGILDGFRETMSNFKTYITDGLLRWRNVIEYCGQFWYLYTYMLVVLIYPALKGIESTFKTKKCCIIGGAAIFGLLFVNDLTNNKFMHLSHDPVISTFAASFVILMGYLIYRWKDKFEGRKLIGILGLVGFFLVNVLRAFVEHKVWYRNPGDNHPVFWYTTFGVLSVYSLIIFSFGFADVWNKDKVKAVINHFGGLTMGIYFIHPLVIGFMKNHGIAGKLDAHLSNNALSIARYQLSKMVLAFIASLIIIEIFTLVKKLILNLYQKSKVEK